MASAAPQKRMVSSVFITLASPHRATVTQTPPLTNTSSAVLHGAPAASVSTTQPPVASHSHLPTSPTRTSRGAPPPAIPPVPREKKSPARRTPATRLYADDALPPPPPPPPSLDTDVPEDVETLLPPPPPPVPGAAPPASSQKSPAPTRQQDQTSPPAGQSQTRIHPAPEDMQTEAGDLESKEVCGFCRKRVPLSEPAIEALNRTYHASCFQCRQCHTPLAGQMYYNKAGTPLCEDCYQSSLEQCWSCGEALKDHVIRALERAYHPACFVCATCHRQIGEERFAQGEVGEVYCLPDYYRKYAPQCSACQQLIIPTEDGKDSYTVECLGQTYHEDCYRCETCQVQLSPEPNEHGCYPLNGRILCKPCHVTLAQGAKG